MLYVIERRGGYHLSNTVNPLPSVAQLKPVLFTASKTGSPVLRHVGLVVQVSGLEGLGTDIHGFVSLNNTVTQGVGCPNKTKRLLVRNH